MCPLRSSNTKRVLTFLHQRQKPGFFADGWGCCDGSELIKEGVSPCEVLKGCVMCPSRVSINNVLMSDVWILHCGGWGVVMRSNMSAAESDLRHTLMYLMAQRDGDSQFDCRDLHPAVRNCNISLAKMESSCLLQHPLWLFVFKDFPP